MTTAIAACYPFHTDLYGYGVGRCQELAKSLDSFFLLFHHQATSTFMRYASATFYGGQLIDAADADYDSYKDLGLLCPHCKDPVFLQAVSQRQIGRSVIDIPAHFKHFKAKDPTLAKLCEARVAKIDAAEIQRRAAQVRNQRLKLLQHRFWAILTSYYENKLSFPISNILESDGQQNFVKEMGYVFSNVFLAENPNQFKQLIHQMIEAGCNNTHIMLSWKPDSEFGVSASTQIQYHFRESLSGKLDQQMQELITCEVLDFLHSKSSRLLVEKIFTLASCVLLDAMGDGALLGLVGADGTDVVTRSPDGKGVSTYFWTIPKNRKIFYYYASGHLCLWLGMLPWAHEMQLAKLPLRHDRFPPVSGNHKNSGYRV